MYGADGVLARRFQVEGARNSALGLLEFCPGDRGLVAALDDRTVVQVDVRGGTRQTWVHPTFATALAAAQDRLATAMPDGQPRAGRDRPGPGRHRTRARGTGRPVGVGVSGSTIITVTDAGVVERWAAPDARSSADG